MSIFKKNLQGKDNNSNKMLETEDKVINTHTIQKIYSFLKPNYLKFLLFIGLCEFFILWILAPYWLYGCKYLLPLIELSFIC